MRKISEYMQGVREAISSIVSTVVVPKGYLTDADTKAVDQILEVIKQRWLDVYPEAKLALRRMQQHMQLEPEQLTKLREAMNSGNGVLLVEEHADELVTLLNYYEDHAMRAPRRFDFEGKNKLLGRENLAAMRAIGGRNFGGIYKQYEVPHGDSGEVLDALLDFYEAATATDAHYNHGFDVACAEIEDGIAYHQEAKSRDLYRDDQDKRIAFDRGYDDAVCAYRLGYDPSRMSKADIRGPGLMTASYEITELLDGTKTNIRNDPRQLPDGFTKFNISERILKATTEHVSRTHEHIRSVLLERLMRKEVRAVEADKYTLIVYRFTVPAPSPWMSGYTISFTQAMDAPGKWLVYVDNGLGERVLDFLGTFYECVAALERL